MAKVSIQITLNFQQTPMMYDIVENFLTAWVAIWRIFLRVWVGIVWEMSWCFRWALWWEFISAAHFTYPQTTYLSFGWCYWMGLFFYYTWTWLKERIQPENKISNLFFIIYLDIHHQSFLELSDSPSLGWFSFGSFDLINCLKFCIHIYQYYFPQHTHSFGSSHQNH